MNKKLLIGLSSMALVAGFWACGEGSVEVIEEQSDDEMIRALLATDNMKFGASDIKKAKDACMNDFECFNEMTKAQGAAIVESSSEEALSSATPVSSTVASSSSDGGFKFSSIGPISDLSSSSEVAPPPQSSSSEEKPLTGLGDCGPSSETVERNTPTTWKFTMGPSFGGISAITSAQFEWTFEDGTPATSTVARSVTSGQVTYSKSGKKTATVKVSLGSTGSETIQCSKTLQVNGVPITGCKCLATNAQPDVAQGESASWTVTGCTSTGATITGYTWTGATADPASATEATAAVTQKGQSITGVSVAVANDDNTVVTVTCPAATAINSDIPDFSISKTDDRVTFDKSGEYSLVADLPQGWHNSDATCTVFCNGGNTSYSVSIDGITIAGTNYVAVQSKMQVAHTIGKYAMPVKVTLGSDNAPIECGIGW